MRRVLYLDSRNIGAKQKTVLTLDVLDDFKENVLKVAEEQRQVPALMEMFNAWHDLYVSSLYAPTLTTDTKIIEKYQKLQKKL